MSFEELLLEATDEGLSSLGESVKQVVYYHLEKNFQIKKQDIPYKIEEFTESIERIFGNGAKMLEIRIIKCLFKKVGYKFKKYSKLQNLTFIEYVTAVKLSATNFEERTAKLTNTFNVRKEKKTICVQTY